MGRAVLYKKNEFENDILYRWSRNKDHDGISCTQALEMPMHEVEYVQETVNNLLFLVQTDGTVQEKWILN